MYFYCGDQYGIEAGFHITMLAISIFSYCFTQRFPWMIDIYPFVVVLAYGVLSSLLMFTDLSIEEKESRSRHSMIIFAVSFFLVNSNYVVMQYLLIPTGVFI